jgi:hypothetical protein
MKKARFIERIKFIQELLTQRTILRFADIASKFPNVPEGTISSLLSHMKKLNHVVHDGVYYELPLFIATPESIAEQISEERKKYIIEYNNKRKAKRTPTIFDQAKPVEANAIQDAITLLKRNGFRVYKSVTELKEV